MPDGLIGKVGRVLVRIREGDPPGEVVLQVGGSPETYLAYCDDMVPVGADVLVVGVRGGRRLDVVPWDSTLTIHER
jgi:nucleotide-binding universal stress UspA family protein